MTHETVGWFQDHDKFALPVLEPVSSYFSIPHLDDKPQDPILRTIHLSGILPDSPDLVLVRAKVSSDEPAQSSQPVPTPLWNNASLPRLQDADRSISWNSNPPSNSRISPFLSEQPSCFLVSLQNWAQPGIHARSTKFSRIAESYLFSSLHLVVLGTSSPLYVWDLPSQSFVRAVLSDASEFYRMSPSILQRFLSLGALVRRLEQLIRELRGRHTNTTVHAFAHGLSSVLMFARNHFSRGPLSRAAAFSGVNSLVTMWLYYAELEQVMISLASMCSRSMDTTPDKFSEIPVTPANLLSLVYETFETHVERHSPRSITAIMAYILAASSKPYIHGLCRLLAYGETRQVHAITTGGIPLMDLTFEEEVESTWHSEDGSIDAEGPFPKFIPESLASILPAAHKSLKLLEGARPGHPILSTELPLEEISWTWSEESIKNLWNGVEVNDSPIARGRTSSKPCLDDPRTEQMQDNQDLAAELRVFDLEPGSSSSEYDSQMVLDELIVSFPNILPNITSSPSLLCEVMFTPLQDHATSLSRALLAVFLDRSSFLCIDAHLELLRSHMLLTSHSFKSRLSAALFSDAEDRESHNGQLYNLLRYNSKGTTLPDRSSHTSRWPVGLAPLLVTRDSWPPGGSELSFLLRTVIVDSQQNNPPSVECDTASVDGVHQVMGEAEFRLGFAIRELSGRGHERWLDPLSIEALDFLYLDYKVPQPLQALIPTAILSKYQRIFALLLRLTRVECAIRSAFRLTRAIALVLFPTLSSSRRILLHFRFAAHSFISILSAYIYGTAIGGNFDVFLSRIAACRETSDAPSGFRDVFALAECHSSVLDDILSACLLRSSLRAAGDLMRGTLEVVLEFCVLVGDLRDGRMEEYQASLTLEALYASFRKKVSALMRTLEVLLERHGKSRVPGQLQAAYPQGEARVPPGGVDALRYLLTCLSQNDWWTKP